MGGIVEGVEMGSRLWLGKPASDLSPAEAAMLTACRRRRRGCVPTAIRRRHRWRATRYWTAWSSADAGRLKRSPTPKSRTSSRRRARWLAPLAAQRLLLEAGGPRRRPGERPPLVASTLDADMQASVERMLLDRVDNLPPKVSMAVLVMDNDSLEIKAYAGSADFSDDSRYAHVDMVRGVRSPGSTLKPFLYAQALDEGLIHSESLLIDAPLSFEAMRRAISRPPLGADQRGAGVAAVPECAGRGPAGPCRAGRFASVMLAGGVRLRLRPAPSPT